MADNEKSVKTMVIEGLSETDRLKRNMYRSDMEKFRSFTKMLRRGVMLKKAIIRHK